MDLNALLKNSGVDIKEFFYSIKGLPKFIKNYRRFRKLHLQSNKEFPIQRLSPKPADRYAAAGNVPQHYFYQDYFAAKRIYENNPEKHVDIGSRIDGFVAHVAVFRNVEVFDIRELNFEIPNVKFIKADITHEDFKLNNYCDSVSCLHAAEHFGLGRYGDPLDYYGHIKGLNNIYKLLKKGGRFYFSAPIGPQRIEYDAHRVFSVKYLLNQFRGRYGTVAFHYIDDNNYYHLNETLYEKQAADNFGCNYGCGIFELVKL